MRTRKERAKAGEVHARNRIRYGRLEYAGKRMEPVTRQKLYYGEQGKKIKQQEEEQ